jgi:hypothetical protein
VSEQFLNPSEFTPLLDGACDGTLTEAQILELAAVLDQDANARKEYIDHISLQTDIRFLGRAERLCNVGLAEVQATLPPVSSSLSPSLIHVSSFPPTTFSGSLTYLASGWPVAYLVATVIFGIGAFIGSIVYVSHPVQVAKQSTSLPSPLSSLPTTVGRITGMADCKWNGMTAKSRNVALGNKYELASGLMEITYDTGAKVILQGPATYEVESKNGGILSVGKLTARVEKSTEYGVRSTEKVASGQWSVAGKSEIKNMKSEMAASPPSALRLPPSSNPSLSTTHYPLFTIKTPTAIVTDLGTEFGVEVDKEGSTTSHVFRGSVEVQASSAGKNKKSAVHILRANESARVESNADQAGGNRITVLASSAEPVEFVREIPWRTAKRSDRFEVVAYWQFDGNNFLADSSGHGHTLINRGSTQIDGTAAFDGNATLSTVDSIDLTPYTKVRVSWSQKATATKTDQFVWEQTENFNAVVGAIAAMRTAMSGRALIRTLTDMERPPYNLEYNMDEYPVADDTWENFTAEFNLITDRGDRAAYRADVVKVFKDGTPIGLASPLECFAPDSFINAAFHIGARVDAPNGFIGQIDNMKIEGKLRSNKAK